VTYSADWNLYLWDTGDSAYQRIISSPHFLSFDLTNGSSSTTINVPFALLNLTVESPLIGTPTQYFPCSPWTPGDVGYTLGRSFLQAAFLAQNWNSSTIFLAQAPGPDFLPSDIKNIGTGDTTLNPATNPPNWASTWSGTLTALANNTSSDSGSSGSSSSGLSGGAIAGIVVGVVVGVAAIAGLVAFVLLRRRKQDRLNKHSATPGQEELRPYYGSSKGAAPPNYYDAHDAHEQKDVPHMAPNNALFEAPGADPAELDAGQQGHELDVPGGPPGKRI
jgi:hypothetical protein